MAIKKKAEPVKFEISNCSATGIGTQPPEAVAALHQLALAAKANADAIAAVASALKGADNAYGFYITTQS
jgi:hypothetical protein